jgi:hypothetical protein
MQDLSKWFNEEYKVPAAHQEATSGSATGAVPANVLGDEEE